MGRAVSVCLAAPAAALARDEEPVPGAAGRRPDTARPQEGPDRAPSLSPATVRCLLTDDDPAVLELLRAWFAGFDVDVLTARTGIEAQQVLERHRVHLLVTDLVMEGMDGIELLRRLNRGSPRPKVLGITGVPGGESLGEAFTAMGAEAFLMKPFTREQFLDAAQAALGRPLRRR
jgi:CheY-like chemotaxis protein